MEILQDQYIKEWSSTLESTEGKLKMYKMFKKREVFGATSSLKMLISKFAIHLQSNLEDILLPLLKKGMYTLQN